MTILSIIITFLGMYILVHTNSKFGDILGIILTFVGLGYIIINEINKSRG